MCPNMLFQLDMQLCRGLNPGLRGVDGPHGPGCALRVVYAKQGSHCFLLVWDTVQGEVWKSFAKVQLLYIFSLLLFFRRCTCRGCCSASTWSFRAAEWWSWSGSWLDTSTFSWCSSTRKTLAAPAFSRPRRSSTTGSPASPAESTGSEERRRRRHGPEAAAAGVTTAEAAAGEEVATIGAPVTGWEETNIS